MRPTVLLAGPDLLELFTLVIGLSPKNISPIMREDSRPVVSLTGRPVPTANAAIVSLDDSINVVQLRELFELHPETRFIFLKSEFPPHAAVSRIVAAAGGTILRSDEAAVVIAATLISMLAGSSWSEA